MIKSGVRGTTPDVAALASIDLAKRQLTVLVWHYHDDDLPGPDAAIDLSLAGLPVAAADKGTPMRLTHYRVDQGHSNAYTLWQKLGSPIAPTRAQYAQLETASQLASLSEAPASVALENGAATLTFPLPRQAVSLLVLSW